MNVRDNFEEALKVLQDFATDDTQMSNVEKAGELMVAAIDKKGKILSCGNGGSMCDAMHFAEELTGRFRDDRKALPAIAIADPSHLSCVGNDYGYDYVFSRYVEALGQESDVLLAISTSGNSANVLKAAEAAKTKGMKIVGLTGKQGGELAALCDVEIRVPWGDYADRIQEIHIKVIHTLIQYIEKNTH